MYVDFPKHTFGVGGQLLFFIKLTKDAESSVTNIKVIETVNFEEATKTELACVVIDTGIPEMHISQCAKQLMTPGIHEYMISIQGIDSSGYAFTRKETRQIIVEDALDGSFVFTNEIGPFIINSDDKIMFRGAVIPIEKFLLRPPLDRQMKNVMSLPPQYKILVEGHVDQSTLGNVEGNQTLSSNRAIKVKELLFKIYGVPRERIEIKGMGERKQKYGDVPGTRLNRNRRVQVIFPGNMDIKE